MNDMYIPDYPSLDRPQLAKEITKLVKVANRRLRNLEKAGLTSSFAYERAVKSGGKFSVRGKDKRQLLKELSRIEDFLSMKSSTVRGQRKIQKRIAKFSKLQEADKIDQFNWALNRLQELDIYRTINRNAGKLDTNLVIDKLYDLVSDKGYDGESALDYMIDWINAENAKHTMPDDVYTLL